MIRFLFGLRPRSPRHGATGAEVTVSFNMPITDIVPVCHARDLFRPESETVMHVSRATAIIILQIPESIHQKTVSAGRRGWAGMLMYRLLGIPKEST